MLRVAAYCRVSTDKDDQLNSLENQKSYFEEYINKNLEWKFIRLYVDEGITGTSTKKRAGFNQMIKDAEDGNLDLIITKEVSRFARNTLDSIFYTRKLKAIGVGVFFLNDNIKTLDPDSEFRLTIMASVAQEESRKTSERVKFGQKRQMEKGVVFGASIFGYDLHDGKLTINEKQAEIVRLLFSLYLEGMGTHILCHEMENRGILSPSGDVRWKNASILKILKNEKYIGTLKQKKQLTIDFLSHKKIANDGREDFVIIKNNHEPIVKREIFDEVQREIVRRRTHEPNISKYYNRYVWSGKIECGFCHSKFKRKIWNGRAKHPQIVWQCCENNKYGAKKTNEQGLTVGCDCKPVYESMLIESVQTALKTVVTSKEKIMHEVKRDASEVIQRKTDNSTAIEAVKAKIVKQQDKKSRLIELYTDGAITRADFNTASEQFDSQVESLNSELTAILQEENKMEDLKARISAIDKAIEHIASFEEFSEEVGKQVLKKIVVHGREQIDVYLAGGNNENPFFIASPITPQAGFSRMGWMESDIWG